MRPIFKILKIGPLDALDKWTNPHSGMQFEMRDWTVACQSIRTMSADARKAQELERRLILFAAQIVDVSLKLLRTIQGRHISSQVNAVWGCNRFSPVRAISNLESRIEPRMWICPLVQFVQF